VKKKKKKKREEEEEEEINNNNNTYALHAISLLYNRFWDICWEY
jgi:hypothetical protein